MFSLFYIVRKNLNIDTKNNKEEIEILKIKDDDGNDYIPIFPLNPKLIEDFVIKEDFDVEAINSLQQYEEFKSSLETLEYIDIKFVINPASITWKLVNIKETDDFKKNEEIISKICKIYTRIITGEIFEDDLIDKFYYKEDYKEDSNYENNNLENIEINSTVFNTDENYINNYVVNIKRMGEFNYIFLKKSEGMYLLTCLFSPENSLKFEVVHTDIIENIDETLDLIRENNLYSENLAKTYFIKNILNGEDKSVDWMYFNNYYKRSENETKEITKEEDVNKVTDSNEFNYIEEDIEDLDFDECKYITLSKDTKNPLAIAAIRDYERYKTRMFHDDYVVIRKIVESIEEEWNEKGLNVSYSIDIVDDSLYIENVKVCPINEIISIKCKKDINSIFINLINGDIARIHISGDDNKLNKSYIDNIKVGNKIIYNIVKKSI